LLLVSIGLFSPDALSRASREDGILENLQVAIYVAAAISQLVVFVQWLRRGGYKRRGTYHLLLFLLLMFVAMEEISWGQRLVGWATPAFLREANVQGETNVHNLWTGEYSSLFNLVAILFVTVYCLILPVTNQISTRARRWLGWTQIPLVGINLVAIFWIAALFHATPMTLATGALATLGFLFPLGLYLTGLARRLFDEMERPLLQVASIAAVGLAAHGFLLYRTGYWMWEIRELLFAMAFFYFSVTCILETREPAVTTGRTPLASLA
jgi:hypothetical protein